MSSQGPQAAQRLASAYLRAEGFGEHTVTEIHPGDDMLRIIARYGEPELKRRLLYFQQGREALRAVEHALRTSGISWQSVGAFLEFACGYGRFTRYLVQRLAPERITTSDILPEAVRFVAARFGTEAVLSQADPALVRFPRRYDVIWVGSLFSHLPRARFEPWLRTLYEQLAPRGVLLFTTHAWERCPDSWQDEQGFVFARQSETTDLELDEYGSTYVRHDELLRIARSCGIAHVRSRSLDLWTTQDLHVASRKDLPGLADWTSTPTARGELHLEIDAASVHAKARGWVRLPASRLPVRGVDLRLDDRDVGAALLGPPIEHQPASERREAQLAHEFFLEGPLPALEPGAHTLAAIVEDALGERQCFAVVGFETR